MKTVIDAVNALEGDIKNVIVDDVQRESFASIILCVDSYSNYLAGKYHSFSDEDGEDLISNWQFICTVNEFNACVDELSAATWINDISLEEWKAGMKNTVIDSHGNELEIGKVYDLLYREEWVVDILEDIDTSSRPYLARHHGWCDDIRECQSPLGTIKKAPVKLVDNAIYQFKCNGCDWVGMYVEDRKSFFEFARNGNKICATCEATDVVRLVPKIK